MRGGRWGDGCLKGRMRGGERSRIKSTNHNVLVTFFVNVSPPWHGTVSLSLRPPFCLLPLSLSSPFSAAFGASRPSLRFHKGVLRTWTVCLPTPRPTDRVLCFALLCLGVLSPLPSYRQTDMKNLSSDISLGKLKFLLIRRERLLCRNTSIIGETLVEIPSKVSKTIGLPYSGKGGEGGGGGK